MLAWLDAWDVAAFQVLYPKQTGGPLWWVMVGLTLLGSGWNLLWLAPVLIARATRPFGWALLRALVVCAGLVFLLKTWVGRPRPWSTLENVRPLWDAPQNFSFPSGHATGSFAVAAFFAAVWWHRAGGRGTNLAKSGALFTVAAAIAYSRVYLGVHYPSDILAGSVLGSLVGMLAGTRYYGVSAKQ
jgi:undecaprenyl-diphosphatase